MYDKLCSANSRPFSVCFSDTKQNPLSYIMSGFCSVPHTYGQPTQYLLYTTTPPPARFPARLPTQHGGFAHNGVRRWPIPQIIDHNTAIQTRLHFLPSHPGGIPTSTLPNYSYIYPIKGTAALDGCITYNSWFRYPTLFTFMGGGLCRVCVSGGGD